MSTDSTKRQPAGIPVGGQFASHDRAEAQVALPTGPARAQLEGFIVARPQMFSDVHEPLPDYPAELAAPKLYYVYGDDHPGVIYLSAEIDDVRVTVWQDEQGDWGDSINNSEEETGYSGETDEQLLEWLHAVRNRVDLAQYDVNTVALSTFHDQVIAVALGTAEQPTTPTPVLKARDIFDPAATVERQADLGHRMLAAGGLIDQGDDTEGAMQTAIEDALANLRHLATRHGLDFDDLDETARGHVEDEIDGRL